MKKQSLIICFLFGVIGLCAQNNINEESLRLTINQQKNDTNEVKAIVTLSNQQKETDSIVKYAQKGLLLARKINFKKGEADCLLLIAKSSTDFTEIIENGLNALNIYNDLQNHKGIASAHLILQGTYREAKDYRNALIHAFSGEQIAETNIDTGELVFTGHRLAPLFLAEISQTYVL